MAETSKRTNLYAPSIAFPYNISYIIDVNQKLKSRVAKAVEMEPKRWRRRPDKERTEETT
jgi:hypothetical protein